MTNLKDDWGLDSVMTWEMSSDNKDGTQDGILTEDEFVKAASEMSSGQISEDDARQWFQAMYSRMSGGTKTDEGGIDMTVLNDGEVGIINNIFDNVEESVDDIPLVSYDDEGNVTGSAFETIAALDNDGSGNPDEITHAEWEYYVQHHMPGGHLLDPKTKDDMFKSLAGLHDGQTLENHVITQDMFERDDFGVLQSVQSGAYDASFADKSEMEEIMDLLKELLDQIMQQNESDQNDGFNL